MSQFALKLVPEKRKVSPMTQLGQSCPSCDGHLRVLDRFCDYSTTRGPLTSYDIVTCDACQETGMRRAGANAAQV